MVSSLTPRNGPRNSSGKSLRSNDARATSKMPIVRSVPLTRNWPSANSRSAGAASSTWLAMRSPFSMISFDEFSMTILPSLSARPEWAPPPTETRSVSPVTRRTLSNGTPSHSLINWAKLVSWPWPCDTVPITTSTVPPTGPSGRTVTSAFSRGAPVAVST